MQRVKFGLATAFSAITLLFGPHADAQQGPPPVEVAMPLIENIIEWDVYTGRFQAMEEVVLQARVSGYLQSVNFEEGELVTQGQLLYQIDDRPFRAAVAEAQARLRAARARTSLAEQEVERAEELFRRRVGPEQEAQRRRAEFQEAVADVALAQAQLDAAQLELEFTQITAPINGRISRNRVDVGNLVVGGAGNPTVLANIVSTNPIEFSFTVSEADFLKYARLHFSGNRTSSRNIERPIYVQLMDEDHWDRRGRMTFVENQLDPNSGTLLGVATLPNTEEFLQPGVFGRLRLAGSAPFDAVMLPDKAIVSDQSRKLVYVVGEDNVASERVVVLGPVQDGLRIIRSGIEPGERVVVGGVQRVRAGAPITPISAEVAFPADRR